MKYGLPDNQSHRIVERHFAVTEQELRIASALFYHELCMARLGMALVARPQPVTVVAAPSIAAPPAPSAPAVVIPDRARPDNLRERLGLT